MPSDSFLKSQNTFIDIQQFRMDYTHIYIFIFFFLRNEFTKSATMYTCVTFLEIGND